MKVAPSLGKSWLRHWEGGGQAFRKKDKKLRLLSNTSTWWAPALGEGMDPRSGKEDGSRSQGVSTGARELL